GGFEPDEHRSCDDRMTDVEFRQVRDFVDKRDVAVINAMTGIDPEAAGAGADCRVAQPFQFLALNFFRVSVGERAGLQLDDFRAELPRCVHLFWLRIDEHADPDADRVQPLYRRRERALVPNEIKPTFGRNLGAVLWHEADFIWLEAQGEIDNLRRVTHFE